MSVINYDYHALKDAHGQLGAAIESFEANTKTLAEAGDELVATNNAEGVKTTMAAFGEKQNSVLATMKDSYEKITVALNNAKELHIANGGEE